MSGAGGSDADEVDRPRLPDHQPARAACPGLGEVRAGRRCLPGAAITVEKDGIKVGGTSIMGLMMLAASPGCSIRVTASGPEAEQAMAAIEELIATRFGEEV